MIIAETISRVRNALKAVKIDPFLTDRNIYSVILKYAAFIISRNIKASPNSANSAYRTLPCVALIEVDKVEACCDIQSGCTIMRTKEKLPSLLDSTSGVLLGAITAVDGSSRVYPTELATYIHFSKTSGAKYDKTKYYYYLNDFLYFPNIIWSSVNIEGVWSGDISSFLCEADKCMINQDTAAPIPEDIFAEVEQFTLKEMMTQIQIPADPAAHDKINILR